MNIHSAWLTALAVAAASPVLADSADTTRGERTRATHEEPTLWMEIEASMRELLSAVTPEISLPALDLRLPALDLDPR